MDKFFVKHLCLIPPPYGGITVYVKRLSLYLCKRGYMSGAFSNTDIREIPYEYHHLFNDLLPKHIRSIWGLCSIPRMIKIINKYRILHNHTNLNTSVFTWFVSLIADIPVVWTIHNQMIDQELANLNCVDMFCFKKLASSNKVQFITVNELSKAALNNCGIHFSNEIQVLPAYVQPVKIGQYKDYLSPKLELFLRTSKPKILFYAESFSKYNGKDIYGTDVIVDLFCYIRKEIKKDVQLVFCLSNCNDEGYLENIKFSTLDFSNDIYWQIGPIGEIWPLLESATVLVRPTCTDGDSVMVREALSFGLPVVASDVTIRPEGCQLYCYGDKEDLVRKTMLVLDNPYRQVYSQKDYTDEMIYIYKRLLNR